MVDKTEIEDLILAADAAGDQESVKFLLEELQSIEQNSSDTGRGIFGAIGQKVGQVVDNASELITGNERSTPEIEALPDVSSMPVTDSVFDLLTGLKVGASTLFADPDETVKILKNNIADLQVRQDQKGNYILKNPYDNKEYAIKPGFRKSDIPKVIGNVLAFTPAGRGASALTRIGGSAATQAAIEGGQALSGGEFNPEDVALAGLTDTGGEIIGRGITALKPQSRLAGQVSEGVTDLPLEDMTKSMVVGGDSSFFGEGARQVMQQQVMPSKEIIEAADKIGIRDYLRADHVSTNQTFKELSAGIASFPMSKSFQIQEKAILELGRKANEATEELGGVTDISEVDFKIRENFENIIQESIEKSDILYEGLDEAIPKRAPVKADNVLAFINERQADGLDLSPEEKKILKDFTPKKIEEELTTLDKSLGFSPKQKLKFATYARLDQLKKDLTVARIKKEGPFKNYDHALLQILEQKTLEDQKTFLKSLDDANGTNFLDDFELAQKTVAIRKGIENDMQALFGRNLNVSITEKLISGVKKLSAGNIANFNNFIEKIPKNLRQEVATSGLISAFNKNNRSGEMNLGNYVKWYEGLSNNKQAKAALFSVIAPDARETLNNFYKVAKGIQTSSKKYIANGRIETVSDALNNANTVMSNVIRTARKLPSIAATEAASSAIGLPGAGFTASLVASMQGGKTDAMQAADKLISDPKFIRNAILSTPESLNEIANMSEFKQFLRKAGLKQTRSEALRVLTSASQVNTGQTQ